MTQSSNQERAIIRFPHLDESLRQKYVKPRLAQASLGTNVIPADTNGWDTVFAIRISDVNHAIALQKSSPSDFSQSYTDEETGDTITINGTFGDWRLNTTGDGKNLHMSTPIATGTMTRNGTTYDMAGVSATIEVNCDYVPPPVAGVTPTPDGTLHALKLKTSSTDPLDQAVIVTNLSFPGARPGIVIVSIMQSVLQLWFNQNIISFEHVFSVVNLNLLADGDDGSFQWLQPTWSSYACTSGADEENSYFGVLCMVDQHDPSGLAHELCSSAIPDGQCSAYMISVPVFLEYSVWPGIPYAFKNAKQEDFKLTQNKTCIENLNDLELEGVKVGAITYTPYVTKFELIVEATEIRTEMKAKINISPGIDSYIEMITHQIIELKSTTVDDPDHPGQTISKQYLDYADAPGKETEINTYTETEAWVYITEAIAGIIVAVLGIVVGELTEKVVARVIIGIIAALVVAVIAAVQVIIEKVIAEGAAEGMPPVDPLVYAATHPIQWPTQTSEFTLTNALINGVFVLTGDPHFADQPEQLGAARSKAS